MLAYDNYQKAVLLQHQRGRHSSAFFKGTHQCAHEVVPFDDSTFDKFHVEFTQHDQNIPSPWGMPAFEIVDLANPASFFVNYDEFETVTLPDFTGDRVRSYMDLKETSSYARSLANAFLDPKCKPEDFDAHAYYAQCPPEFDRNKLRAFSDQKTCTRWGSWSLPKKMSSR